MPDNPYDSPQTSGKPTASESPDETSPSKAAYNVVSDTVTGVNLRGSDNKFQAKFIAASVCLLALVGIILSLLYSSWQLPWYGGALVGAFTGLIIGVFASGIFLMVYRATRHIKGKHD